jgi:hypothetical protein
VVITSAKLSLPGLRVAKEIRRFGFRLPEPGIGLRRVFPKSSSSAADGYR